MKWEYTVNDLLITHWDEIQNMGLNNYQLKHLHNIRQCHTAALGGSILTCKSCGHQQYQYHSCRNRHCPSCQGSKREAWIAKQEAYLMDVPYFHVVFTIPSELRSLCIHKPRELYSILFRASKEVLDILSTDPKYLGAKSGMTAVLHTWSQNLQLHPHIHCIVPGGGITKSDKWKNTRSKGKYLFPAKVMATLYRAIFMRELKILAKNGTITLDRSLREQLYAKRWVVYAKRPFKHPSHVIEYLGRYTHKIAISNYRLVNITDTHLTFKWKNYRKGGKQSLMTLTIKEFIRRFALHILPHNFVRIRHYGILSSRCRNVEIKKIQAQQNYTPITKKIVQRPIVPTDKCSICKSTNLITTILPRQNNRSP